MKEIRLFSKEIGGRGEGEKPLRVTSVEMIRMAIEGNETNRKGLLRIRRVMSVLGKIEKAEKEKAKTIRLEDQDFDILYESVDKYGWGPGALRFPEFFEEMEEAKTRKVEEKK